MGAQPAHSLCLTRHPLAGYLVQAVGLDQREGDIAVKDGVPGQIDFLLAAFTQKSFDLVATAGK
jgi:hypothetical protein